MARAWSVSTRGFTLLEVIIVLGILSILIAIIAPFGYQLLTAERQGALEAELQAIHTAILGSPERSTFGYVGDVGKFPASLLDLVVAPRDSTGTPVPGWRGPYLSNPRVESGLLIDPLSRPWEYFLKPVANGVGNQLAIVSRGADGVSTNTATNPNVAASYVGPPPVDSAYAGDRRNADNVVFPRPTDGETLNVVVSGALALNVLNYDANPRVNAFVPACPQLFTVTAASVAREATEANLPYVQGLQLDLVQGSYRVTVVPQGQKTVSATDAITVQPGAIVTRTLNLTGLDSSGTPRFNLTVKNGFAATDLEVFEFDDELSGALPGQTAAKGYLKPGEARAYTPHGCAQIYVRQRGKSTVVDQFVMPYGSFTRVEGLAAASLTVTNKVEQRLRVFRNAILIGTVPRGDVHDDEGRAHPHVKTKTFQDLSAGDLVEIKTDRDLTLLSSFVLAAGTNTATIQ